MARDTLLDFFRDRVVSREDFLIYDDGYRWVSFSYDDVRKLAGRVAARLRDRGFRKADKVLFWGENRPEWVIAFWGCILEGIVVVPIDYRASGDLLVRVRQIVGARLMLVGNEVHVPPLAGTIEIWKLGDIVSDEHPPAAKQDSSRAEPRPEGHGPSFSPDPGGGGPPSPVAVNGTDQLGRDLADARPKAGRAEAGQGEGARQVSGSDLAEIIFTSGATAEPKGVLITHRNILANIVPVEQEVLKYRKYGRPFFPLRFLNLLPLSHMFGQAMATFIPPMLPGTTVFLRGYNPSDIVEQIRRRRVSVLVCVPKILDVLREHVLRIAPEARELPKEKPHWTIRWWRFRRLHRLFGWKFWCFVVGAAPLDPELEEFWSHLGFLVIQGYGLTETAPIVTLNHPFRTRRGTVGTPIGGVQVKIAPDGEILVRGENVTSGYFNAPDETRAAFEEGWFHTGDIGALDQAGRLIVRGRKKEVIVTPEGLNVFPEDVERAVAALPGVRDAAVVGITEGGEERVHAVVVLEANIDPARVVREANRHLEDHQKIRGISVWPNGALPRTEGTQKLRRRAVKAWVETGGAVRPRAASEVASVDDLVRQFARDREVSGSTTLDELGLSSLERVELMMALEQRFDTTIDESSFSSAATVADLRQLVEVKTSGMAAAATPIGPAPAQEPLVFPSWNRSVLARALRRVSLPIWILPLTRLFAWIHVEGLEHLAAVDGPVVYAANHQSHMDTPVILAALPPRKRYRVAPAMAKEFFAAHFHPQQHTRREWLTNSLNYHLAALFFNAFPLPQREGGTRQALRYIADLVGAGFSVLIFPEGRRTERGEIARFQPGIGMMASRLRIPVIPVRLEGVDRILHHTWRRAKPGPARVAFGRPLYLEGTDYLALAARVEGAVRAL